MAAVLELLTWIQIDVATAALTILTDVLVLALPFWVFLGLQMANKTKVALIGIFVMGGLFVIPFSRYFLPNLNDRLTFVNL